MSSKQARYCLLTLKLLCVYSLFYPFVCGCGKGDWCRAEWSEDGIVYEAEVATVNRNQRTAEVVFLGFGNREEKSLDELFMSKGEERRQEQLLASKEADIKEVMA